MKAILIGATGLVGGLLLEKLLTDPLFTHIKVVSRKSTGVQSAKLDEILVDFNDEHQFRNAITPADVLFCCIGTTQQKVKGDKTKYRAIDFGIPVKAAAFCAAQNTRTCILVSSVGANADSKNFYLRLKGETESAILQQSFEAIYIMRPSFLTGNRKEFRALEFFSKGIMQFLSVFLPGRLAKYRAISAEKVAGAMLSASKKSVAGKFIWQYREMTDV